MATKHFHNEAKVVSMKDAKEKRTPKEVRESMFIDYPDEVPKAKKMSKKYRILMHTFLNHA